MKFQRENATEAADLPHEFADWSEPGWSEPQCGVCTAVEDDPRHLAWERQQLVDRETASASFSRELGS
jgi:hypothetical protein